MYPADWIWQKYGLCLGWRCADCKEKVLARSLPFKGLRKRNLELDEVRDIAEAAAARTEMAKDEKPVAAPRVTQPASRTAGRRRPDHSK